VRGYDEEVIGGPFLEEPEQGPLRPGMQVRLRLLHEHYRRAGLGHTHDDGHEKLLNSSAQVLEVGLEAGHIRVAERNRDCGAVAPDLQLAHVGNDLLHQLTDAGPPLEVIGQQTMQHIG
jgi:hypothetical protein